MWRYLDNKQLRYADFYIQVTFIHFRITRYAK